MRNLSKDAWLAAASIAIFAIWKLSTLEFRFGDENVYFYMTKAVADGLLPYRDFFIADPPFFILILSAYKWIIGERLILFKVWPVILDCLTAAVIYLILRARQIRLAALGPILYLFSFTVLATSDYATGAELTVFLMLAALYADLRGKPYWSGALWALSCLAKLYAAPALIGFLAYKLYKREFSEFRKIVLAGLAASLAVLLPFAIMAPRNLYYDLILHQFNRPAGLDKWRVWGLFGQMEWLLALLAVAGAYVSRHKAAAISLALTAIFFLWYRDLYYLYLHILIPLMVLLTAEALSSAKERLGHEAAAGLLVLYALVALYPLYYYVSAIAPDGVYVAPQAIAEALREAPDGFALYGIQEVAPLAGLMAGRELFETIIDTNTQNFASGTHDRGAVSRRAAESGVYLITRGDSSLYFDPELFKSYCAVYKKLPQDITVYSCHKSSS